MKLYKNGLIFKDGSLQKLDILCDGGKIAAISEEINCVNAETQNCAGKNIFPALFDIHTHGCNGFDFNLADESQIRQMMIFYQAHGVGSILPTLLTDNDEVLCRQLELIANVAKTESMIKGIHLEGPFLSGEYCGAMPPSLLQKPDYEKFKRYQKCARNLIKLVTVSPELSGAAEFVRKAAADGVTVSLGHSGASYEQTIECLNGGAKSFTHTFNAMKLIHQHSPNIGGAALISEGTYCELICDGRHLNPLIVKFIRKNKTGDYVIAVTDSIMAAGLNDGKYKLGVNDVTVKDGDALLTDSNVRAGSTLTADQAVKNFADFCGLKLEQAISAMTSNPAKLMGMYDEIGSIDVGKEAKFWIIGQ